MKLYLTGLKGLDKCPADNIKLDFTNESVSLRLGPITETENKIFTFSIKKTCHKINPDKSYHKVKSDYLLLFLAKHNPGSDWSHITFAEKVAADNKKKSDEPKLDDKADPSASLMNVSLSHELAVSNFVMFQMMKKMYDEGDDEMKRTIAKAWTEGQEKKQGGDF